MARTMAVLAHPDHQMAFLFMALLTFTGFLVFPNIPIAMVKNVGLTEKQLPLIYLVGGICTVFSMNWIGRWADRSGKHLVFVLMSLSATVPIVAITNLPQVPLFVAIATSTLLMICMSGRMVPAMALMTASIEARYRGGFMSINSAVQQLSMALASDVASRIISQGEDGRVLHFPINGLISVVFAYTCIYLARFLRMPKQRETVAEPVLVEMG